MIALHSDERLIVPLDKLHAPPWENPKSPIGGAHKEGLVASLETFHVRDDLKVWPHPDKPGEWIVLDGNQRLSVLRESGADHVEIRVLSDLDEAGARVFNAGFDRNHAAYDEEKVLANTRHLVAPVGREVSPVERRFMAIVRPRISAVPAPINKPTEPPAPCTLGLNDSVGPQPQPQQLQAPDSLSGSGSEGKPRFRPLLLNLSAEGYDRVSGLITAAKTSLRIERTIEAAISKLTESAADSFVIELALTLLNQYTEEKTNE